MADDDDERDDDDDSGEEPLNEGPEGDTPMSFFDHLAELRKRVVRAFVAVVGSFAVAWYFVEELENFITIPLRDAWYNVEGLEGEPTLQTLSVFEAFLVDIRIAVTAAIFVAAPIVFYQVWMFVAPGLYSREKKVVVPFVATSAVMFIAGASFCYFLVIPVATEWFLGYPIRNAAESAVDLRPAYTFTDYTKYTTRLLLAFGLVFEFPLAIYFLAKVGAVTHKTLLRYWKISMVGFFVIAAFLTPPEPITQVLMAMPMVVMYFASIGVAYVASKPHREAMERLERELAEEEAAEAEEQEAAEDDEDAW